MTKEQFIKEVEKEQGPLRRFLRALCRGDEATADDVAQEALLKAYLHFNDFNGKSKFSTWLYRIAYNSFSDWYATTEKKERNMTRLDDPSNINVSTETDIPKNYKTLYNAIGGLPADERTCVLLFYMEDRSIAEISNIMNMPSGTVKSHLSRARNHLKTKLKTWEE